MSPSHSNTQRRDISLPPRDGLPQLKAFKSEQCVAVIRTKYTAPPLVHQQNRVTVADKSLTTPATM